MTETSRVIFEPQVWQARHYWYGPFDRPCDGPSCDCVKRCRVFWNSHGCSLERGHPTDVPCRCDCADEPPDLGVVNVGAPPYYGEETQFYGEDAEARGLPLVSDGA